MKALVLAGGKGTRLRPLTHTIAKQLIPVANKPVLFYVLEQIAEAGITDIGIIISPDTAEGIKEAVGDGSTWGSQITYILQPEPLGIAHALKIGQGFLNDSPFLMLLGDNLIKGSIAQIVEQYNKYQPDALLLLKEVSDPRSFGVAEIDGSGHVVQLQEKPKEPRSNLAIVGIYLFSNAVHRSIAKLKPSWRGEFEITDAIQDLITAGKNVQTHILKDWWIDVGGKDDLLRANRVVLDDLLAAELKGKVDSQSQILGKVEIREGTEVVNSTVHGPLSIAEDCRISNSILDSYTSVGKGTIVEDSHIKHSVILESCSIRGIDWLEDSVIGRRVELAKFSGEPYAIRVFIGDDARAEF